MKTITITFIMDNATFLWVWSVVTKDGGNFNELLVDYYINEIAEKFPDVDEVIPKIYGVTHNIVNLIAGAGTPDMPISYESQRMKRDILYSKLKKEFFVEKSEIINPIEVGI